jgi:hypothetical protein
MEGLPMIVILKVRAFFASLRLCGQQKDLLKAPYNVKQKRHNVTADTLRYEH